MFEVDITLKVNSRLERVWTIVSDTDNDYNYWKEIHKIKNISKERNVIERDVYLYNGDKCHQRITLFPKEGLHVRWTRGIITGVKDIMLIDNGNTTIIRVQINYKNGGAVRVGVPNMLDEFKSGTETALKLIKKDAECRQRGNAIKK